MRTILALFSASALLVGGCANESTDTGTEAVPPPASTPWMVSSGGLPTATPGSAWPSQAPLTEGTASGAFLPAPQGIRAITYDPTVVPAGATASVVLTTTDQGVRVQLTATGMVPRRTYGAHLHTMACTAVPDQAGPHYQHQADPSKPSVDPEYANPENEIWLDFTADATGAASATSTHSWNFADAAPQSLIVHAERTKTTAGKAGTAGERVACLSLRQ